VALAPGERAWWAQARYLFDSDFQSYVDEIVSAGERAQREPAREPAVIES
jgi:hypothetical protein